jgi:hypothetical protein
MRESASGKRGWEGGALVKELGKRANELTEPSVSSRPLPSTVPLAALPRPANALAPLLLLGRVVLEDLVGAGLGAAERRRVHEPGQVFVKYYRS